MSPSQRDYGRRPLTTSWVRVISLGRILCSVTYSLVVNHLRVRYFGVHLGEVIVAPFWKRVLIGSDSCGKTTLARLLAKSCDAAFKELSATDSGISQLREVFEEAKNLRKLTRRLVNHPCANHLSHAWVSRKTIVFFDEIHRFNKAQQVNESIRETVFSDGPDCCQRTCSSHTSNKDTFR
jgi:ATP-dependent protease HslVU (ClpYQ) ATPase subunit